MQPTQQETVATMSISLASRIILSTSCAAVFTVGSFLNISLLFVLIRSHESKNRVSTIYLYSLLTSQISGCLYEAPYYFLSLVLDLPPPPQAKLKLLCRISIFITYFIAAAKVLNLTVMSLDRYIAIVFPFVYERYVTTQRVLLLAALTWFLPLGLVLPIPIFEKWTDYEGGCGYACGIVYLNTDTAYVLLLGIALIAVPLLMMLATNIKVYLTARQQHQRVHSERNCLSERSFVTTTVKCQDSELIQYTDIAKVLSETDRKQPESSKKRERAGFSRSLQQFSKKDEALTKPDASKEISGTVGGHGSKNAQVKSNAIKNSSTTHEAETDGKLNESHLGEDSTGKSGEALLECVARLSKGDEDKYPGDLHISKAAKSVCFDDQSTLQDEWNGHKSIESNQQGTVIVNDAGHAMSLVGPTKCDYQQMQSTSSLSRILEGNKAVSSLGSSRSTAGTRSGRMETSGIGMHLKHKKTRRLGSNSRIESPVRWSLISSTLFLVLAFFITYVPFLITRILLTNDDFKIPEEVLTYAALLTITGNLINPCIILGTRRKLKTDFMKVICHRKK